MDGRTALNRILFIRHAGGRPRFLHAEFGNWARCRSKFRRWTANRTWASLLAELHQETRGASGRDALLSLLVARDILLARGAANEGATSHDQGGFRGWT